MLSSPFFEKCRCLKDSCPSQKPKKCMLVSVANVPLVRYCCTQTVAGLALYSSLKNCSLKERYRNEPTECVFQTFIVNSNFVLLKIWKVLPTLKEKLILIDLV